MSLILILGWFPFMFLCAASIGYQWSLEVKMVIISLGILLCIMGGISLIILGGNEFWHDKEEIEKLKEKYRDSIKQYEETKTKLENYILKQEND